MACKRVSLQLRVSGNNLTNVCKLVFKVSMDETNDIHFAEGNILGKSMMPMHVVFHDPTISLLSLL